MSSPHEDTFLYVKLKQKLCVECQACCKVLRIFTAHPFSDEVAAAFYRARGFKVTNHRGHMAIDSDMVCPNLGEFGCKIYMTRPEICRNYDGRTDPMMKGICKWNEISETLFFDTSEKSKGSEE